MIPLTGDELQHTRFITAKRESEVAVRNGEVQDVDAAFAEIQEDV